MKIVLLDISLFVILHFDKFTYLAVWMAIKGPTEPYIG